MNSLHSSGRFTTSRTCTSTSKPPWKNCLSVKTEMQLAPALAYSFAIATGLKFSRITPLLGLAFLISAITAGLRQAAFKAATKSKGAGNKATCSFSFTSGTRSLAIAISRSFAHTISSRMCWGFSSGRGTPYSRYETRTLGLGGLRRICITQPATAIAACL